MSPLMLALLLAVTPPPEKTAQQAPAILEEIGIEQRLGESLPLDLAFRDETGRLVTLGDYFHGRPVVLALVYYECPMLCTLVLNGLTSALGVVPFDAGTDYEVVAVSIDPGETPDLAAGKKESYTARYNRPGTEGGWHFLTGAEAEIRRLADAAGFHYRYDAEQDLYAHAAGIMLVTPQGKLSRYLYGVEFSPKDLRLALVEASEGRIGSAVDQVLLYCYRYDPATGRYSAAITNIIRLGGVLTVVALVAFVVAMRIREARRVRRRMA